MYLGASWKGPLELKGAFVASELIWKLEFLVIIASDAATCEGPFRIGTPIFGHQCDEALLVLVILIESLTDADCAVGIPSSWVDSPPLNNTLCTRLGNIMDRTLLSAAARLIIRL
jgi:hypothetical protein